MCRKKMARKPLSIGNPNAPECCDGGFMQRMFHCKWLHPIILQFHVMPNVIVTYPAAPECNVCESEVYEALRWNHVKLSERLLISPVPALQLTCACVHALKIHELGEALLSCVTLLEIAWKVGRGERVDVGSRWICEWEVGGNTEREGKGEREQAYIKHGREGQVRAKIETKDSERASGLF